MDSIKETVDSEKSKAELNQFKESFETFNNIINNLQRQYLSLEKEFGKQGRRLEDINRQLRQTIKDNREVTSFLNSILTSLTSGVVAVNKFGVISHFNSAAERITGIEAEHALGKKYDEIFSSENGGCYSALDTVMTGSEFDSEEKIIVKGKAHIRQGEMDGCRRGRTGRSHTGAYCPRLQGIPGKGSSTEGIIRYKKQTKDRRTC